MTTLERAPTREVRTPVMESDRWNGFAIRPDDIVIATYPKCGTTWTQRIVSLLIFQSTAPRQIIATSPWIDCRFQIPIDVAVQMLEAQTHRRAVKSHLPFDALPIYDDMRYIHVARDGRDACMSFHNHVRGFTPEAQMKIGTIIMSDPVLAPLMGGGPPPQTPEDPQVFFQTWIAEAEGQW